MRRRSSKRFLRAIAVIACGWRTLALAAAGQDQAEPGEEMSGGAATVMETTRDAFSFPLPALNSDHRGHFMVGHSFFNQKWVTAPASATGRAGLGPLFQANSCSACHVKDGRGAPPEAGGQLLSMLVRLSIPGRDANGGPLAEPTYGLQLDERAIPGVKPAGAVQLTYVERPGEFPDGTTYSLREPTYRLASPGYGEFRADVCTSARVAPALCGDGLLEQIPEKTLLELSRGQGAVAGRPNYVWDEEKQTTVLGRFGWKANEPGLRQQIAHAFVADMGITSSLTPNEPLTDAMAALRDLPHGGSPEISDKIFGRVVFYIQTLAVPGRRDWTDSVVLQGKRLFAQAGCATCHTAKIETGDCPEIPELAHQVIRPYTDLLLHDMGDGLADRRPDFLATGREWRTPPLWGIGLVQTVNRHTNLLHDGRARDLQEAILWHGGQAESARNAYCAMETDQRAAVLKFLNSL